MITTCVDQVQTLRNLPCYQYARLTNVPARAMSALIDLGLDLRNLENDRFDIVVAEVEYSDGELSIVAIAPDELEQKVHAFISETAERVRVECWQKAA